MGRSTRASRGPRLGAADHFVLDELEVFRRNFKQAESEHIAPALFVRDEAERIDQRSDRNLMALEEVNIPAPGCEAFGRLHLVQLVVGDLPDRGERLQRLSTTQTRLRGVEDDPIARAEPADPRRLSVAGLRESALCRHSNVVTADRANPMLHCYCR